MFEQIQEKENVFEHGVLPCFTNLHLRPCTVCETLVHADVLTQWN